MSFDSTPILRRAVAQDAATIRHLVRAAYAKWVPLIGREPLPMTVDYDHAVRAHDIDLLSISGVVSGLIETMLRPDHLWPDYLWIENVAVRPDCQGRGLGRILLAHAEHKAAAAGQSEIRLLTNAAFGGNVALYERFGYRVDRREAFRDGITVYMRKLL